MTVHAQPVPILSDNYAWLLTEEYLRRGRHRRSGGCRRLHRRPRAGRRPARPDPSHPSSRRPCGRNGRGAGTVRCEVVGAAADASACRSSIGRCGKGTRFRSGPRATVFETPGHTVGHISFYFPGRRRPDLRGHAVQPWLRQASGRHRRRHVREPAEVCGASRRTRWSAVATNTRNRTRASRSRSIRTTPPCRRARPR